MYAPSRVSGGVFWFCVCVKPKQLDVAVWRWRSRAVDGCKRHLWIIIIFIFILIFFYGSVLEPDWKNVKWEKYFTGIYSFEEVLEIICMTQIKDIFL